MERQRYLAAVAAIIVGLVGFAFSQEHHHGQLAVEQSATASDQSEPTADGNTHHGSVVAPSQVTNESDHMASGERGTATEHSALRDRRGDAIASRLHRNGNGHHNRRYDERTANSGSGCR